MSQNQIDVRVSADASALRPGMEGAANDVERSAERMQKAITQMHQAVETQMTSLTSTLGNVKGAISSVLSVLAGGSAFSSGIEETKKLTGEANGLAKALNISKYEASVLNVALGDIRSSSEAFIGASQMLSRQLRTNEDGLNTMGLKTREANGEYRNMKDMMFDAIKVLNGYKEGTDRALAAQAMFGRGGTEVMSMLRMNNELVDEARDKAEKLGLIVGSDNVAALKAYKEAMNDVEDVISGMKKAIGDVAMPHLTELGKWLGETGPNAVKAVRDEIDTLGTVAIGAVLTGALKSMSTRLVEASTSLAESVQAGRQASAAKIAEAQATVNATAAIRDHTAMLLSEAEAAVANASGMSRLTLVTNTLIPARERHEAATRAAIAAEKALADAVTESSMALSAANAVINALGGPIGALITALGAGATAWAAFGDRGRQSVTTITEEIEKGRAALARFQREQKFGTGDEGQLRESLDAVENRIGLLVQSSGTSSGAAEKLAELRKEATELQEALNAIEAEKTKPPPSAGRSFEDPNKGEEKTKAVKIESKMPAWEAELSRQKAVYMVENDMFEMSLADEKKYWDNKLATLDKGDKEYGAVQKKSADLELQMLKKTATDKRAMSQEEIEERRRAASSLVDIDRQGADEALALGHITQAQRLALEQQYEQRRYEINRDAIQQRMDLLAADPNMNPVEYQKLKDQMLDVDRQYELKKRQLSSAVKVENMAPMKAMATTLESSFAQAFTGIITKANSWKQALGNIYKSLLGTAVQTGTKMLSNWLFTEQAKTAASVAGTETRTAAEETAAGESVMLKVGTAIKTILVDAYEAMAGAFAAMAGIPYVGPVLAVGAGAAAFAAVAGLAGNLPSAAGGYDIPSGLNPMTQLHEEEMVLPAYLANPIRSKIASGEMDGGSSDGGGGNIHIHVNSASPKDMIRSLKDGGALQKVLREYHRNFTFVGNGR